MTFEGHLLDQAEKELENCEKLCTESSKIVISLKKIFGFSLPTSSTFIKDQVKLLICLNEY